MEFLGIEIGGTKIQLGLGRGDGVLRSLWRGRVDVAAGPEGIRRQIQSAIPELLTGAGLERSQLRGIGIGFGGPVDDNTQRVIKSHQIAGWDDFALGRWMQGFLDLPTVLGNDADVAGLAEANLGAGKGLSPVFYITVGSGIGGGLIVDGEIYRGVGRGAAEIGHLRIPQPIRGGLSFAPLEATASGWGMEAAARKKLKRSVTVPELFALGQRRDPDAEQILDRAWYDLAEAISHVIALLCPRRIVIGGGVSLLGEPFFTRIRELVAGRVFRPFDGLTDIVPAALGEEVVVHGALALAARRLAINDRPTPSRR